MKKDSGRIKSAYELAMERLGGVEESPLADEQKQELAEIKRVYEGKIAETKIVMEQQIAEAMQRGDAEAMQKLQEEMISQLAELRSTMEREREKVRQGEPTE